MPSCAGVRPPLGDGSERPEVDPQSNVRVTRVRSEAARTGLLECTGRGDLVDGELVIAIVAMRAPGQGRPPHQTSSPASCCRDVDHAAASHHRSGGLSVPASVAASGGEQKPDGRQLRPLVLVRGAGQLIGSPGCLMVGRDLVDTSWRRMLLYGRGLRG
jgi:hypothetical protein